ncbi:hypothetical protein QN277_010476 [Acacia crassicarpa]|uniref:Fe2OG dioxygenase domain-containing protein n=1 Tax=Acacia crassicarpa TaxID=499986 RepID=A0AAE1M8Z0_9FABA|nr:hypothetical protein QN277_010476 [Acacia crassicarpa]
MASGGDVDVSSVKSWLESNAAPLIPSYYHTRTDSNGRDDGAHELAALVPVIDFSLLTSDDPQTHAAAVRQLGQACQDWGFFIVTNHGVSENLLEDTLEKCSDFHNLPLEEKKKFCGSYDPLPTIKYATSALPRSVGEDDHYWIDHLKFFNYPNQCNTPHKPPGFYETATEFCKEMRGVARTLLEGISESLGLKPGDIIEHSAFDVGYQKIQINLYPPCPQPDLVLGLPAHCDNGIVNILIQNGVCGLQVKHAGKWVDITPLPNSLIVNTGDDLEVLSNGKYKSIWHRAVVNEKESRLSVVAAHGPQRDKEIGPAPGLLEKEKPLFKGYTYDDLVRFQLKGVSPDMPRPLDAFRINN